jgi:hypothetical protein
MRLRFWLLMLDAASWLDLHVGCPSLYLWCVGKAGGATDWGTIPNEKDQAT